jgi:hypothetical protein
MPPPGRALVASCVRIFTGTDRGVVRRSNDQTMDNRAAHFRDWLATSCGYSHLCCAVGITAPQAVGLIAAYVNQVASMPYNKQGDLPRSNTLSQYANAAFSFLRKIIPSDFDIYEMKGSKRVLVPFIGKQIARRRKWQPINPKRDGHLLLSGSSE